jgi:hypothetical protein
MPPEVACATAAAPKRVHASMDIWSVGIVLLELAGWHGLGPLSVPQVQAKMRDGSLASFLQGGLLVCEPTYARLIADCLKLRPESRPTAGALLQRVKHMGRMLNAQRTGERHSHLYACTCTACPGPLPEAQVLTQAVLQANSRCQRHSQGLSRAPRRQGLKRLCTTRRWLQVCEHQHLRKCLLMLHRPLSVRSSRRMVLHSRWRMLPRPP